MKPLLLALTAALTLTACLPAAQKFDPDATLTLDPKALGPTNSKLEWWYLSSYLPEEKLSLHWALFKVNFRGFPYYAGHIAVSDLNTGKVRFIEQNSQVTDLKFPPLSLTQGDWKYLQTGANYTLEADDLKLTLEPLKNPVVHPPGYSGTPEVGQMYYQSITRLNLSGTVAGRPVKGVAWFDHQWGDQIPGSSATWDWMGQHASNGSDLMLYRVKNIKGDVVQVAGSWVDAQGVAREVKNLTMTPREEWTSSTGRKYLLGWTIKADDFTLELDAVNKNQELLSNNTFVAYWEGAMAGKGSWQGQDVEVHGMGEFVSNIPNGTNPAVGR